MEITTVPPLMGLEGRARAVQEASCRFVGDPPEVPPGEPLQLDEPPHQNRPLSTYLIRYKRQMTCKMPMKPCKIRFLGEMICVMG